MPFPVSALITGLVNGRPGVVGDVLDRFHPARRAAAADLAGQQSPC